MTIQREVLQSMAADARAFLIGQDVAGHWLAIETHGRGGGIFVTRDDAMRYARAETGQRPGGIVIAPRPIALA